MEIAYNPLFLKIATKNTTIIVNIILILFSVILSHIKHLLFLKNLEHLKIQSKKATINANIPNAIATITNATLSNIAATIRNAAKKAPPIQRVIDVCIFILSLTALWFL